MTTKKERDDNGKLKNNFGLRTASERKAPRLKFVKR